MARLLLAFVLAGLIAGVALGDTSAKATADPAALARARATVQMLDGLYKGFVVNITSTYVKARERTPAAAVLKRVFAQMAANGVHEARLIDATGEPVNRANVAKSAFEKRAVAELRRSYPKWLASGAKGAPPAVEEVATVKGRPVLRAATVVPVVMKACLSCHPGLKEGELMGAITYEVPIK
jgi:hypothetical protein